MPGQSRKPKRNRSCTAGGGRIWQEDGIMKEKILLTVILILAAYVLHAQDRIYFIDADPVDAIVEEIGDDYVLYKSWDNPDGPNFRTSTARVDRIVFRNGTVQDFGGREDLFGDLAISHAVVPGRLDYRRGRYYMGMSLLTPDQVMDYVGYRNYGSKYLKASRQRRTGLFLTYLGGGLAFVGGMICIAEASVPDMGFGDSGAMAIGTACCVAGAAGLAAGIPLLVKGNRSLGAIADDYNARKGYGMAPAHDAESLTIGPCASGGLGLAFNF